MKNTTRKFSDNLVRGVKIVIHSLFAAGMEVEWE